MVLRWACVRLETASKTETRNFCCFVATLLLPADFPIKLVIITVAPTTAVEISIKVAVIVARSLLIDIQSMIQLPNRRAKHLKGKIVNGDISSVGSLAEFGCRLGDPEMSRCRGVTG